MKKFIITVLLASSSIIPNIALAQDWVGPALLGGILGYSFGRSVTPSYPPPVYYPPQGYYPPAVPYASTLPPAPYGYQYAPQYVPQCNCHQWVLIPIIR